MGKAIELGISVDGNPIKLIDPFNFHDLKAKGVSDHTEHHSGHKTEKARQIYIRKLQQVDATR
jgi:hypothetical protein